MSQNKSTQTVRITIIVSQRFFQFLEAVAKSWKKLIEEYVADQIICGLDTDLHEPAGPILGFEDDTSYQDQLRAMIAG